MFSSIKSYLWGVVALLGTITYLFLKVLALGANADDLKESREALKAARERRKTDDEVDDLTSDDVVDRLRKNGWFKDN